jgi:hypothetical protein
VLKYEGPSTNGGIAMKNVIRVMVLVAALVFVGTGAMAAELLFAFRATPMFVNPDDSYIEIGTYAPGDSLSTVILVEKENDQLTYGELKVTLKGKGVSARSWWQDIPFDLLGEWILGADIDTLQIPEGVYTVTFQFREMVKGAKWQKLMCRFQIVGTPILAQAKETNSVDKDILKAIKVIGPKQ